MFNITMQLPKVEEVQRICPLSAQLKTKKARMDADLIENLYSRRKLTVVSGPCSADNPIAVAEYAQKLFALQQKYSNLFVVARVYTTKPHSNGEGYGGLCFHKTANAPCNLTEGIVACRKMMISVLEIGLPVADELLYPELYPYFSDLVSYWFVGARSSEDSLHRAFASGLNLPCGVKNSTNGLLDFAVNNLHAVSRPCVFPFLGSQIQTEGNKSAHVVLRGGTDKNGFFANISPKDTARCKSMLRKQHLCDFLMADLSHANSQKVARNQLKNALTVAADKNVDGVMVESYLFGGTAENEYGVSQTDDCLDIVATSNLLQILSDGFAKR